ncbi:MAG: hypothetical protein JKY82_01925 [Rhizobiaceae bacterium]|nr:hypothetical protein [Rhizobiaceae bacterium]MBL4731348.1 hypothetical protein [Rhizobiaceae bacterium]
MRHTREENGTFLDGGERLAAPEIIAAHLAIISGSCLTLNSGEKPLLYLT